MCAVDGLDQRALAHAPGAPEQRIVGGITARELQRIVQQDVPDVVDALQQVQRDPGDPGTRRSRLRRPHPNDRRRPRRAPDRSGFGAGARPRAPWQCAQASGDRGQGVFGHPSKRSSGFGAAIGRPGLALQSRGAQLYSPRDFEPGGPAHSRKRALYGYNRRQFDKPTAKSKQGACLMFVTPAFAQAAGAAAPDGGVGDILIQLAPILLLVVIFWLLIFRPQQKRMKAQQAMLVGHPRGDTVVTTGGIVGKVTKAVDGEDLEVEIAQGVQVKIVRGMIADVRSKSSRSTTTSLPKPKARAACTTRSPGAPAFSHFQDLVPCSSRRSAQPSSSSSRCWVSSSRYPASCRRIVRRSLAGLPAQADRGAGPRPAGRFAPAAAGQPRRHRHRAAARRCAATCATCWPTRTASAT